MTARLNKRQVGRTELRIPELGFGTVALGLLSNEEAQIGRDAAQRALSRGMTFFDTAPYYGNGRAELRLGEALSGAPRDSYQLASKVGRIVTEADQSRENAWQPPFDYSYDGVMRSFETSLKRLRTDRIDLYLLHWRSGEDLPTVVRTFGELVVAGKIRHWGVSNFDVDDLEELARLPGGEAVACNQVLYNASRRGIEYDLLPAARQRGLNVMAYTPIEPSRLLRNATLREVAARHDATPLQVALAWTVRADGIVAIPRTGSPQHVRENAAATELRLSARDLEDIDRAFPPPAKKRSLEMI
jgi:aryl-alcohol dehydrogenase-like predicted oxidoreductase